MIDLMDVDEIWRSVEQRFDTVQKNLLSELMSKELMKGEKSVIFFAKNKILFFYLQISLVGEEIRWS